MVFCKRKTAVLEAFRVGYHTIPAWLKKELFTGYVIKGYYYNNSIEVEKKANGKHEITIKLAEFTAKSGDWIVKGDNGKFVKYEHKDFIKIFEVLEER